MSARDVMRALIAAGALPDLPLGLAAALERIGVRAPEPPRETPAPRETVVKFRPREEI